MKYSIIPKPVRYEVKEEKIKISAMTPIHCIREFESVGSMLSDYLRTSIDADDGEIVISKAKSIASEGYALYTENGTINIKASTLAGAYYGAVTLKWILMQAKKQDGVKTLDGFLIEDKPCYRHRGMMLDESRHFFGAKFVKSLLDNMAMLKINVFHWHLADDQGFRIESKTFPKLNEIGSKRDYSDLRCLGQKNGGGEYGPFYYTHEEIREIVDYAKQRQITVIPELDIPGHCTAMIASYPELSCDEKKVDVAVTNGILRQILCAGNENTFDFLEKIFDEICPLFDGEYFHIGGDEANYYNWKHCPKCKQRIKDENLKNEKQLQGYFMCRVNEMLNKHGKKCIAWNDCLNENLDSSIACQYWIFKNKADVKRQAAKREIIFSPMLSFYFDMKHKYIPTEKVYRFNEKSAGFNKKCMKVRGVEAELWTEWIDSRKAAEYSIYPRIAAVAEVGWDSPKNRNIKDFKKRLTFYKKYLDSRKINYYVSEHRGYAVPIGNFYSFGAHGKEFSKNEKKKLSKG